MQNHHVGNVKVNIDTRNAGLFFDEMNSMMKNVRTKNKQTNKKTAVRKVLSDECNQR